MSDPRQDLTARALLGRMALLAPERSLLCLGPCADRLRVAAEAEGWTTGPGATAAIWFGPDSEAPTLDPPAEIRALAIIDRGRAAPGGFAPLRSRTHTAYLPLHSWIDRALPDRLRQPVRPLLGNAWFRETVSSRIAKFSQRGTRERWFVRPGSTAVTSSASDRLRDLCMSALGLGHLPLLAANWTSLATVLVGIIVLWVGGESVYRITCATLALLATLGCVAFERWSARHYLTADAREVTLDEVAGMSVTLAFLPIHEWASLMPPSSLPLAGFLIAFLLFRVFDIFKPGIHWIEKTGWRGTIVWDDLLAGLYAGIALRWIV